MKQRVVLVITDGIGHNESDEFNAFSAARKPTYEWLFQNAAHTLLKTSGEAVGLPAGQMGNSEVGHMSIGAGRILYQNLVKIDKALADGSLGEHRLLVELFARCKRVHIVGLFSDGGVHSMHTHFLAVYDAAVRAECETWAHAITDGRDVLASSGAGFIRDLQSRAKIASLSGRFYAMDRDNRYERVKQAYDAMVLGANPQAASPAEYINECYAKGEFDEFITPASFNGFSGIGENDGVVFINFRNDRMRELVGSFGSDNFEFFERPFRLKNLITMTEYDASFSYPVLFEKELLKDTLPQVISDAGFRQFHTAETEKYAHVTFFFNGGVEDVLPGESRLLVPSPKVKTYDLMPQMASAAVGDAVLAAMDAEYEFIVVNFANGDMVGHTGDFTACVKAVEAVDKELGRIVQKAQQKGYAYVQISDHGNCEQLADAQGRALTNHTTFDVYAFVIADGVKRLKSGLGLANVAATVLEIMGLEKPDSMSESLI